MTSFYTMLLIWSIVIFTITLIITESKLFEHTRKIIKLPNVWYYYPLNFINTIINCYLCTSVWVSVLVSYILFSPSVYIWPYISNKVYYDIFLLELDLSLIKELFFDGMLGAGASYFLKLIEVRLFHGINI